MPFYSSTLPENWECNIDNRLRSKEEKYANDQSTPFPPHVEAVLSELIEETVKDFVKPHFMVVETQRKLLYQLVKLFSAKDVLEIGTFTGTSAIAMALALSEEKQRNGCGGQIVSLEIDPKAQAVARKYIEKLGLDDCVDLRLGPGLESLAAFAKEQPERQFDFVFIDADKPGYVGYYDFIMDNNLLSDRGVIIADNVLFFGQVHRHAGYDTSDSNTIQASDYIKGVAKQMEKFNQHVSQDPRTRVVMLPLFDGMSIITKNNSQGSHPNNNKL